MIGMDIRSSWQNLLLVFWLLGKELLGRKGQVEGVSETPSIHSGPSEDGKLEIRDLIPR